MLQLPSSPNIFHLSPHPKRLTLQIPPLAPLSPLASLPVWMKEMGPLLSCCLLFGVVFLEEAGSSVNPPPTSQPCPMAPALTVLQETLLQFPRGYPWEPPSLLMPSLSSFRSSENSPCHMLKPPELSEFPWLGNVQRSWLFLM